MEEKIEQYLQNEYQDHIKWYKKHYYDTNYSNYENWYKEREEEYSDLVVCDGCSEVVHEEDLIDNDFVTEGGKLKICESCYDENYCVCDDCGDIIRQEDAHEVDDDRYVCEYCMERRSGL